MRIVATAVLVLVPALSLVRAEPPAAPKADDPPGLLEVTLISTFHVNGKVSFNEGRQYVISINEHLPEAKASRSKLVAALHEQKQLDQVVFGRFGKKSPTRLNLSIGEKVPVEVAQAVVVAYVAEAKLPVLIELMTEDGQLGDTQRVYVGGFVDCGTGPVTPEQIKELLKPGLTREQFAKIISKKRD